MKTRTGFISNSSSSSFIIEYQTERNTCPHCNRGDPNLFEDYEIETKEDMLQTINDFLQEHKASLIRFRQLPLDKPDPQLRYSNIPVKEHIEAILESITQLTKTFEQLVSANKRVVKLEIPHHECGLLDKLYQAENDGLIKILENSE